MLSTAIRCTIKARILARVEASNVEIVSFVHIVVIMLNLTLARLVFENGQFHFQRSHDEECVNRILRLESFAWGAHPLVIAIPVCLRALLGVLQVLS